jgi:hypothetical protein
MPTAMGHDARWPRVGEEYRAEEGVMIMDVLKRLGRGHACDEFLISLLGVRHQLIRERGWFS